MKEFMKDGGDCGEHFMRFLSDLANPKIEKTEITWRGVDCDGNEIEETGLMPVTKKEETFPTDSV